MIKQLIVYWFRRKAVQASKKVLISHYSQTEIRILLLAYWKRYRKLKKDVQTMPTIGGSLMVHLAAMSTAFYKELRARGQDEKTATEQFYNIAWEIYQKMGRFAWWLAGWDNQSNNQRLKKATDLFRKFPFNSPSYQWKDISTNDNIVGFDCLKCPVAEYFQSKGLSKFCAATWCSLDFPLAEMWDARLERNGSLAGGADKCDFRWIPNDHTLPQEPEAGY